MFLVNLYIRKQRCHYLSKTTGAYRAVDTGLIFILRLTLMKNFKNLLLYILHDECVPLSTENPVVNGIGVVLEIDLRARELLGVAWMLSYRWHDVRREIHNIDNSSTASIGTVLPATFWRSISQFKTYAHPKTTPSLDFVKKKSEPTGAFLSNASCRWSWLVRSSAIWWQWLSRKHINSEDYEVLHYLVAIVRALSLNVFARMCGCGSWDATTLS